ncbi:MAG: hypothetical protein SW833_27350 [Cyanobacteriota bacterium]|nr:hypothetical protein [Cyanobacteriota bacterium]
MSEHRLDRIVIERPRSGMRISSRRIKGHKKELGRITKEATIDGLLQPYLIKTRNRTKSFSDHISPLYRWLRSKVGQPWDKVYGELCWKLDSTTLSGQHILSHVWGFVERHVVIIDGIPYQKDRQNHALNGWRNQLYVHPETGILCLAPKRKKAKSQPCDNIANIVQVDPLHQYRKLDGVWYFVTFGSVLYKEVANDILPHKELTYFKKIVKDVLLNQELSYNSAYREYGSPIYARHKRHATKKEIKKIKQRRGS